MKIIYKETFGEIDLLNIELINSLKEDHSFDKTEKLIKQLKNNIAITNNKNPLIELILSNNFNKANYLKMILDKCNSDNTIFNDPNLWMCFREKQQKDGYMTLIFSQRFKKKLLEYDNNYLDNLIKDNYTYGFLRLLEYADIQEEMCKTIEGKNLVIELIKNDQSYLFKEYLQKYKDLMIMDNNNLFLSIIKLDIDKYRKSTYIDMLWLYCDKNSEMFKNKQEILKAIKESNLANTCKQNLLLKLDIKDDNLINKIINVRYTENKEKKIIEAEINKDEIEYKSKIIKRDNQFKKLLNLIKATIKKLFTKDIKNFKTNNVFNIQENLKNNSINIELKNEIIDYINIVNQLKESKIILNNFYEKDLSIIHNKLENIIRLNNKKEILMDIKTNININSEISDIENENILFIKLIKELKDNIINELKQNIHKEIKVNKKLTMNG